MKKFNLWFVLLLGFALVTPVYAGGDPEADFQKALQNREEGNYAEAISQLQQLLATDPSLGRVKAELALTLMRSLQFAEAKSHAAQLLADPNTPEEVKITLRRMQAKLEKESATHTLTPSLNIGYFHDDNVNVGPSSDVIDLGGITLALVPGSSPRSDTGMNLNAQINHRYLSPKTLDIGSMKAALLWLSDAAYIQADYKDEDDYDVNVLLARTGPRLIVAGTGSLGIYTQFEDIRLGDSDMAEYHTLGGDIGFKVKRFDLRVSARRQDRNFDAGSNSGRESQFTDITLSASYPIIRDKLSVSGALRSFDEDARDDRFTNDGHEASLGVVWEAWNSGSIRAVYSRKTKDHKGVEPLFGYARDGEKHSRLTIEANHEFKTGVMDSWVLSGYVIKRDNDSNVSIYDYDRTQVGVNMGRSF